MRKNLELDNVARCDAARHDGDGEVVARTQIGAGGGLRFVTDNNPAAIDIFVSTVLAKVTELIVTAQSWLHEAELALHEGLLNAIFHGNLEMNSELSRTNPAAFHQLAEQRRLQPPYCHRRVELMVEVSESQVVFSIRDEGPGFEMSLVPDPFAAANLDQPCGRGLMLMRDYMDQVTFRGIGNTVRMSKRIDKIKQAA